MNPVRSSVPLLKASRLGCAASRRKKKPPRGGLVNRARLGRYEIAAAGLEPASPYGYRLSGCVSCLCSAAILAEGGGVEPPSFPMPRFSRPIASQPSSTFHIWRKGLESNQRSALALSRLSKPVHYLSATLPLFDWLRDDIRIAFNGAARWNRTTGLLLTRQLLYQLS